MLTVLFLIAWLAILLNTINMGKEALMFSRLNSYEEEQKMKGIVNSKTIIILVVVKLT
jgi:hypothetical protein